MGRTFSKGHWDDAQALWKAGSFSTEWRDYRHEAAMRGMIYPPEGTRHDSWEDDEPSQRALLIRAIRETPQLTHEAIARSKTWGEVVEYILRRRDDWRHDLDQRERLVDFDRATPRQALMSLGSIIGRIRDSL